MKQLVKNNTSDYSENSNVLGRIWQQKSNIYSSYISDICWHSIHIWMTWIQWWWLQMRKLKVPLHKCRTEKMNNEPRSDCDSLSHLSPESPNIKPQWRPLNSNFLFSFSTWFFLRSTVFRLQFFWREVLDGVVPCSCLQENGARILLHRRGFFFNVQFVLFPGLSVLIQLLDLYTSPTV